MKTNTKETKQKNVSAGVPVGPDFVDRLWEESWTYIKTVVDVVREPILILDKDLRVMAANEPFYQTFQVDSKDTEKKIVYELGNGQWNIPSLKKLLEDILPRNTFFKGYEVDHDFPSIGHKVMILNARRIYKGGVTSETFPPIILLAMEDITEMMAVAKKLADHTNQFETKLTKTTERLEALIKKLGKEVVEIRTKQKSV